MWTSAKGPSARMPKEDRNGDSISTTRPAPTTTGDQQAGQAPCEGAEDVDAHAPLVRSNRAPRTFRPSFQMRRPTAVPAIRTLTAARTVEASLLPLLIARSSSPRTAAVGAGGARSPDDDHLVHGGADHTLRSEAKER